MSICQSKGPSKSSVLGTLQIEFQHTTGDVICSTTGIRSSLQDVVACKERRKTMKKLAAFGIPGTTTRAEPCNVFLKQFQCNHQNAGFDLLS